MPGLATQQSGGAFDRLEHGAGDVDLVDAGKVGEAYTKLAQQMAKWEEEAKKGGD